MTRPGWSGMSVLVPLAPDSERRSPGINPVAKLTGAIVVLVGLVVTSDPLTPALLLAIELAVLPFTGVRARTLLRRTWPLLLSVSGVALTNMIVVNGGEVLLDLGSARHHQQRCRAAASVWLRLLAITLPGIVVLATTDPMDLADALVQCWHAPARFAYGALAALAAAAAARRRLADDRAGPPGARARRRPVAGGRPAAVRLADVRGPGRVDPARRAARDGDGGAWLRLRHAIDPLRVRNRCDQWTGGLIAATVVVVLLVTAISVAAGSWAPALGG